MTDIDSSYSGIGQFWIDAHNHQIKEFINLIITNNMEQETVDFGAALIAAKNGKRIARQGWNGKDMFVFMRPSDNISVETIVDKVKSLPESVKKYYKSHASWSIDEEETPNAPSKILIKFTEYLCMKAADDSIVNGWLASQTDMLSNDWVILD